MSRLKHIMDAQGLFRLDGRVAVVTGGSGGIGRAIAVAFAQAGATVAIADINGTAAWPVCAEIDPEGQRVMPLVMDVGDEAQVREAFQKVHQRFGAVDVLVNCAGRGGGDAPPEALSLVQWNEVLRVNLTGTFLCCREAGAYMIPNRRGAIINVASVEALVGRAYKDEVAYGTSKGGVVALT